MHSFCSPFIVSLFFFSFLEFFRVNCFSVIVLLVLIATSNGSILFLTYHPRSFSSLFRLFSYPINSLPPFFLETYNRATSLLGCNSLFIVINFLVFLPISCSSFLFHLRIPAPHLKIETTQVFGAIILFLPFSLLFKINFVLLKYSFLNLSFILVLLLCHTRIFSGIYIHLLLSLVPDFFLFSLKGFFLYEVKASGLQLSFNIFR